MPTSYKGACFMARQEALVTVAYKDGAGLSIGLGDNDPNLKPDSTTTPEAAWTRFLENIRARDAAVDAMFSVPVEQHIRDAAMSHYFQGGNKARVWTAIVSAGLRDEGVASLLTFNRDSTKNKFSYGLAKRRLAEATMIVKGDYGDLSGMKLYTVNPHEHPLDFTMIPFPPEVS